MNDLLKMMQLLIAVLFQTISPKTILPGEDYVFLTFVAIPVFFTLALIKQEKNVAVES